MDDAVYNDEDRRRTASIWIWPDEIRKMLGLPEGAEILHIIPSCDPVGMRIVIRDPHLPPVPPQAESPVINSQITLEGVFIDHGKFDGDKEINGVFERRKVRWSNIP